MKKNPLVHLKRSSIHNRGLFAATDIPAETAIIQYLGDKITEKKAILRNMEQDEELIYLFQLNKRYWLDGDIKNNPAKYINCSCNPNCYALVDKGEIWIYALKDIKKGDELSYDYGFGRPGWDERSCLCGSENCFGFVVAREHWSSIRRTKKYQRYITS